MTRTFDIAAAALLCVLAVGHAHRAMVNYNDRLISLGIVKH
jgi:hypothetical protein